jgi:hypothetical protein
MSRQKIKSKMDPVLPDQAGHSMRIDPQNDEIERIEEVRQRAHQLYEARVRRRGHAQSMAGLPTKRRSHNRQAAARNSKLWL